MERVTIDVGGPVSVIEYGGSGPLAVCIHGLEGSAYNWRLVADALARTHTVVAPDLIGFGYTEPAERSPTVEANAGLIAAVIEHYGGPAMLIGNSMGGLVSLVTAAAHPESVESLVLIGSAGPVPRWSRINPSTTVKLSAPLVPGLAGPLINAYRATRTVEEGVQEAYEFVTAQPERVDEVAYADALEVAALRREQPWATQMLIEATRSIAPYVLRRNRYRAMVHKIPHRALVVHGTKDEVVKVGTSKRLVDERPDWTVAYMEDVGHIPMIEEPELFMDVFDTWQRAVEPDALDRTA